VVSELRDRGLGEIAAKAEEKTEEHQTLMLFRIGERGRMAIPLSLVARLEEFPASAVEQAGAKEVVQYRGRIMPLFRLSQILHYQSDSDAAPELIQVVVYSYEQRSIGLVIDQILDIVEESVVLQPFSKRDGVLGSAVIGQRITELLDVPSIIQSIDPKFFEQALAA
jgi:two-component system, chemotaxis family, sensor kinase CheA